MAQLVKRDSNTGMVSGLIPSVAERDKTVHTRYQEVIKAATKWYV